MTSIHVFRFLLLGLILSVPSGLSWAHEEPLSAQSGSNESGPVAIYVALSHAAYTKSDPQTLLLKIDYSVTANSQMERPPLNIALVLDRSGSMAQEQKFPYTIEAARQVIENMTDRDILAIIAFNDKVTVLSPAGRVVNKQFLFHRLTEIAPAGYTDISTGVLEGIAQIDSQRAEGQVQYVLLLTDGIANRGITDAAALRHIVEKARARGIGLSTFGCGTDFNEKRLTELAATGGGRYTYIKESEQIPTAFVDELQGLLQPAAQNAVIEIVVSGGQISKVYGQLLDQLTSSYKFDIGNLRAGERGSFMVELKPSGFDSSAAVEAEVRLTFDDSQTGERVKQAVNAGSAFSATTDTAALGENQYVILYGNVLNALEKAEEAAKGLDVERARQARAAFEKLYEQAHQLALQSKDQELLNQTFLLKHFMEELGAAEKASLLHSHSEAQKKLSKESAYERYLLMHHQPHALHDH
jgi:Ca-activated chloride channel family protein